MYFIAKVIAVLIRDSLLMNCGSDRIATHQTIHSPTVDTFLVLNILCILISDCHWCCLHDGSLPDYLHFPLYLGNIRSVLQPFYCIVSPCRRRRPNHLWRFQRGLLLASTQHCWGINISFYPVLWNGRLGLVDSIRLVIQGSLAACVETQSGASRSFLEQRSFNKFRQITNKEHWDLTCWY